LEEGRQLISRQLHRRLLHVNSVLISRLQTLSLEDVERLGEDLLDFHAVEDFENWFQKRSS
jgi:hypothetical protein